jgi:nucleotide-binding universal stress UspA family protein
MAATQTPAAVAAGRPAQAITRVIVGSDDSPAGLAALAAATDLAASNNAELVAVRCWALGLPRHGGRRMRHLTHPHVILSFSGTEQRAAARVLTRKAFRSAVGRRVPADLRVTIETPEGDPALALVALAAREGDVLVVGTHSGSWVTHLVHGSVSRYCARHARCPVILVAPGRPAASHGRQRRHRAPGARTHQP